ncbi:MAG: bacteriohopanetetrol glucosamine biosynthesis glycosyltransferase HpnI [Bryobacterales bacterium]|nr:bacteriohopanetetrol glucosamine biosynthesis glycosyltransferase HpnI [Bryobacterales bacterium]
MLEDAIPALVAGLVLVGCAYYALVLLAAQQFLQRRRERRTRLGEAPPNSVLKPLAGEEPELAENLGSFFRLSYPRYEVLCAARDADDPALAIAREVQSDYPDSDAQLLVAGESDSPNAKVHSLAAMTAVATGELVVVSDSDIRADPALLWELAKDFEDPVVGVVTCPYRAVPGPSLWSRLEALGMNTEFWSGVLVAQFLAPMNFAVGPTMAVRKSCLDAIGGWEAFGDFLAEDFEVGRQARLGGYEVRLSTHVVEHRIGSQALRENLVHRLRWRRSTRRSRPVGYWGEILANPLPWALLLPLAASGAAWSWAALGACVALRASAALVVGGRVLGDTVRWSRFSLLPLQDGLSLLVWFAGLFGRRIVWRGRAYELSRDGRLRPWKA